MRALPGDPHGDEGRRLCYDRSGRAWERKVDPEGCSPIVPLFLLNRLPEVWGADAAEFRPDRFLAISGGVAAPAQGFLPFGSAALELRSVAKVSRCWKREPSCASCWRFMN